jgi:PAS domain S-box-containing protein
MNKTRFAGDSAQSALDAISSCLALLNEHGEILTTNMPWREFGRTNGGPATLYGGASNYLSVCDEASAAGSEGGRAMAEGIRSVMQGVTGKFELAYPCDSPTEKRHFIARVSRFDFEGQMRILISHEEITHGMRLEDELAVRSTAQENGAAELAIANQELLLQKAIFNSANFSSIATDARGVIQIFNVGAECMLGYTAAEVVNQRTPADISDAQEIISRAKTLSAEFDTTIAPGFEALVFKASRGIEDIYELTYIRKDGSRLPAVVSVTALRDDADAIIGYLLIGTDNTARKQIEEERKKLDQRLRDQQFYTRSLIEANIDAIMTTDPAGIITDLNKQMELLTDCTRDELIGAPFKNFFTDPDRAEAAINLVLREKKVTNYELTARTRDGRETVVSYNATTFYDRERNLQGVFAAARDVTERNRLYGVLEDKNGELEAARALAEKANSAKSDFLSSMSHELRSPLNAILGFAQLMESETPALVGLQQGRIEQILRAGWHLLNLINEILDLAKIESRQIGHAMEQVHLGAMLRECRDMIEPQALQYGVALHFAPIDPALHVWADSTRLKQVFINLLTNAIKYNRRPGTVAVHCSLLPHKHVRISICDTGPGLSADQQLQLFQAFNRLGQEAGAVEGTGIGLVVAKQLAELMGGTIGVQSTLGEGSIFWIEMDTVDGPAVFVDGSDLSMGVPMVARQAGECTLLYVEDNPANMQLMQQIIERQPMLRLLTAANGIDAIALARSALPDVLLLDINLPGLNGFEILKLLRADVLTAHIPALAISANAMESDVHKGQEAGFLHYITKPIKVDELMLALHAALETAERGKA